MLAGDKVPTTAILDQLLYHCHVVHVDGSSYRLWEMEQRTRSGITGWAQVNYHHTSTLEDYMRKAEFDLFYINRDLLLDLQIVLKMVETVLGMRGGEVAS
jgi:lipopolysaccharide/colanic/teichoic acid biosynthesis glycosyltransferase